MIRRLPRSAIFAIVCGALCLVAPRLPGQTTTPIPPQWLDEAGPNQVALVNGREAVANEVLVKFRDPAVTDVAQVASRAAVRSYRAIGRGEIVRMRSGSRTAESLIAEFSARPDVEYAEPNYVLRAEQQIPTLQPDDPGYPEQWGLRGRRRDFNGITGRSDADIDADAAWSITTGSPAIVVAVLDTGIDYNHPDLGPNVWQAPARFGLSVGGQTILCFVGTHGYNAVDQTCDPMDDDGHGTHVSGTIGAAGNNNAGVTGVNWRTSVMGLKVLDANGVGSIADAIDAIEFAIQVKQYFANGGADVRVINASWGIPGYSQAFESQIQAAFAAGMIFVTSAGNNTEDDDIVPHYPSDFDVPGLIAVAATDPRDELASFSNYGATSVDLGAPGYWILSTLWNNGSHVYAYASGTSMAAAHVSGAAALILSACDLSSGDLKDVILSTTDPLSSLFDRTVTGGRLNVYNAIDLCRTPSPTFTLGVQPRSVAVVRGEDAIFQIDVRSWFGFSGMVDLSLRPSGSASFSPASVLGGSGTAILTIPSQLLNLGTRDFTITGYSGGLERRLEISVDVSAITATPVPMTCGETVQGLLTDTDPYSALRPGVHHDRYSFDLVTGGDVTLFMRSYDFGTHLTLLDANGQQVESSGQIERTLAPGSYVVEATSYETDAIGAYSLTLACPGDPPRRDDLIVDFGDPYGIYVWQNDSVWRQIHHASSEMMVTADLDGSTFDDVIIDFGIPYGVWDWRDDSTWRELAPDSPLDMVVSHGTSNGGRNQLVLDFGAPAGIRTKSGSGFGGWWDMSSLESESMVAGDVEGDGSDRIFIDAGDAYGIRVFDGWYGGAQLHSLSPEAMVTGDLDGTGQDELVVDFGPAWGIWSAQNYTRWVQIHNFSPVSMVTGDLDGNGLDEVVIDFGSPYGIYVWENDTRWVQLHWVSPGTRMVTGDLDASGQDDLVIDFGPAYGIYIWKNNSQWVQLHQVSAEAMVIGSIDGF